MRRPFERGQKCRNGDRVLGNDSGDRRQASGAGPGDEAEDDEVHSGVIQYGTTFQPPVGKS